MMTDENAAYPKSADGQPRTLEAQNVDGERRFSPSVGRNRNAVAEAFLKHVASDASVLEIGSGTGEHGVYIAAQAPSLQWTFTEYNEDALAGIAAWVAQSGHAELCGPFQLDAAKSDWGAVLEAQRFDVVFSANVIHISPFTVAEGIFAGAGRLLAADGKLVFYGPFASQGDMAKSNANFDADLKRRDPEWGVRDIERELVPLAAKAKLELVEALQLPSNNMMLVFGRA